MNQQLSLERMVDAWMADEAALGAGAAEQLSDQIIAATGQQRPRPRWLALLQESPMRAQTQVVVGSPTRRLTFVVAAVVLAALVAAGIAGAILLQPQPPASDDWPGFRGDASRAGFATSGPIGHPIVQWTYRASGGIRSALAIIGETVLVPSDDGVLSALALADGTQRWSFTGAAPVGGIFGTTDRVYFHDGDGIVHALSTSDGQEVWAASTPLQKPTDITKLDDRLFVGTADNLVVAIDANTGAELWRTPISPSGSPVHAPTVGDKIVVAATDDHLFAGMDPSSGEIRWRIPTGPDGTGTPIVAGGVAYIGGSADSATGRLTAVEAATGTELWRVEEGLTSPSVAGTIGYTGSATGAVAALDLTTGDQLWRATFDGIVRAPAIAADVVYLTADRERRVVALDRATGGELWSFDVDAANECCVAVSNGIVFVGTSAGTVYAIGGNGQTIAAGPPPSAISVASATPSASPVPTRPPLETDLVWTATSGRDDFNPWGMSQAPDGTLWVTEGFADRFSIFTTDGEYVESWGTGGTGDGQFDLTRSNGDPFGMIAFRPDGGFYVLDAGNRRIQRFGPDRQFITAWGGFGSEPGRFNDPLSIVVEGEGTVHVLDDVRNVIESYDENGALLKTINAAPTEVGPTGGANQVALGPNGHFYVSLVQPNEVLEIDRDGVLVATYGGPDSGDGAFTEQPNVMTFDSVGRLYVTQGPQRGNHPGVMVFGIDGSFIGGFGPLGGADDELGFPWGLVVTDDGIYIADAGGLPDFGFTSLIRKFEPITFP